MAEVKYIETVDDIPLLFGFMQHYGYPEDIGQYREYPQQSSGIERGLADYCIAELHSV